MVQENLSVRHRGARGRTGRDSDIECAGQAVVLGLLGLLARPGSIHPASNHPQDEAKRTVRPHEPDNDTLLGAQT